MSLLSFLIHGLMSSISGSCSTSFGSSAAARITSLCIMERVGMYLFLYGFRSISMMFSSLVFVTFDYFFFFPDFPPLSSDLSFDFGALTTGCGSAGTIFYAFFCAFPGD